MMQTNDPLSSNDPILDKLASIGKESPPVDAAQKLSSVMDRVLDRLRTDEIQSLAVQRVSPSDRSWSRSYAWLGVVASIVMIFSLSWMSRIEKIPDDKSERTISSVKQGSSDEDRSSDRGGIYFVGMKPNRVEGELINGDFEAQGPRNQPLGWFVPEPSLKAGYRIEADQTKVKSGSWSVQISADKVTEPNAIGNLIQSFDATSLVGKRIRFRAFVCTADLSQNGQAQLWVRVDRKGKDGASIPGAFDNMQDRPIRSSDWKPYEIVLDVAEDAQHIVLGAFLLGVGKAWIDDASLEVVGSDQAVTGQNIGGVQNPNVMQDAYPWLMLAIVVSVVLFLSQTGSNAAQRLAWRFSFCYWILYSLPVSLGIILPIIGLFMNSSYAAMMDGIVRWSARNLIGIDRPLVSPNGSGDTTFDYVRLLVCVMIAFVVSAIWFAVDRKRLDYSQLNDLLRSYLRYTLAASMIGYGLAKLTLLNNQFPSPSFDQLMKPYGESSPMNLLWTFMGSSRGYTQFAGGFEFLGGFLLMFRRTTLLGAMVTAGVMLNVVLLNFCYDVPVKQYSFHLFAMAIYILLYDMPRLIRFFFSNQAVEPKPYVQPYKQPWTIWIHLAMKVYLIFLTLAIPVTRTLVGEYQSWRTIESRPVFFGTYEVVSMDGVKNWRYATFVRRPWGPGSDALTVRMKDGSMTYFTIEVVEKDRILRLKSNAKGTPVECRYELLDGERLVLRAGANGDEFRMVLKRESKPFLLIDRGFHWINEYPFNR